MKRQILDGYVGIKFEATCERCETPAECARLHEAFRVCGERLASHGMAPANGGNLSQAVTGGIVITTAGCNLGIIEPDELALVRGCSLDEARVRYAGVAQPSSETMMHWLIYRDFPAAGAVVHAHDDATSSLAALRSDTPETPREEPYGTVALARLAAQTFAAGGEIIVLKNHGYLATGPDLERAVETVVRKHLELVGTR
jgi:ribulose-5-phosphate 4-epimerase/fuculose-1-phosphate aldolase